jgi:hypothetical protein
MLLALAGFCVSAADEDSSYTPVATPKALQRALRVNLKIVEDWVNDKDYVSAVQTTHGLIVLAQLYGYQSTDKDWQQRTKTLAEASGRLLVAARQKDETGCAKSVRECADLLEAMAKQPPTGPKVVIPKFATFGSTKTWMLLMDGAYVDAKSARSPAELEDQAFTLAETLNVSSHLRNDAQWRTMALDTRRAALAAAAKAAAQDVDGAKRELKLVYVGCESCHQGTKKK